MTKSLLLIFSFALLIFASCDSAVNAPEAKVANAESEDDTEEVIGIGRLAADQLAAYNAADLDAFCACYHPEVRVFDGETEKPPGIEAFRERYVKLFATEGFGAGVSTRLVHGRHCIDLEDWWRAGGKRGKVIVRYTERDGLIGVVQFLK